MPYTVTRYAGEYQSLRSSVIEFRTLTAARTYIRSQIGGRSCGTWTDEDGNECWHESRRQGCGGYCIERREGA